jgi:hypothetical protein
MNHDSFLQEGRDWLQWGRDDLSPGGLMKPVSLFLIQKQTMELDMVMHTVIPATEDTEEGGS